MSKVIKTIGIIIGAIGVIAGSIIGILALIGKYGPEELDYEETSDGIYF